MHDFEVQESWSFSVSLLLFKLIKMSSIANKVAARWLQRPSLPAGMDKTLSEFQSWHV